MQANLKSFCPKEEDNLQKNSDLKPKECYAHAVPALDQHLTIPIQGSLTQTDLFRALLGMVAMHQSIHSVTGLLEHVVYPVRQGISKVEYIIARCLDRIAEIGLHIEALSLDRELYTQKVLGFLIRLQVPFIVPAGNTANG